MRAAWLIVPSLLILGACGDPLADIERVTDDTFIPDTGVATALPTQAELEREDSVLSGLFRNREEPEVVVEQEATLEGDAGSVDVASATTGEPAPGRKGMLGWLRRATVEEQVTAAALVEQSAVVGTETADGAHSGAAGEQVAALTDIFPAVSDDRIVLSPNGYNQDIFTVIDTPDDIYANRRNVLRSFQTLPFDGSPHSSQFVDADADAIVVFCGKFADWKRLDALLGAAAIYEQRPERIVTLIVGTGPIEDQRRLQSLAYEQLRLTDAYFLGPRNQDELAGLVNAADIGCFPSYREPFGLVFLECMACGTPVIGANSGGPRDFVAADVGHLVEETDDRQALSEALAKSIGRAINENWKQSKGPTAARYAARNYSVSNQVSQLLKEIDQRCA